MVFNTANKDLRLLLRALIHYAETNNHAKTNPLEIHDVAAMRKTIVTLLLSKRKRGQR